MDSMRAKAQKMMPHIMKMNATPKVNVNPPNNAPFVMPKTSNVPRGMMAKFANGGPVVKKAAGGKVQKLAAGGAGKLRKKVAKPQKPGLSKFAAGGAAKKRKNMC